MFLLKCMLNFAQFCGLQQGIGRSDICTDACARSALEAMAEVKGIVFEARGRSFKKSVLFAITRSEPGLLHELAVQPGGATFLAANAQQKLRDLGSVHD